MQSKKNLIVLSLFVLLVSIISALFSCGLAYHSYITPQSSVGEFNNIRGDAWIESNSSMTFKGLAARGNRLDLLFSSWKPDIQDTPHFKINVCGKLAADFSVEPGSLHSLYLKGECEPRQVTFDIVNPFRASEEDTRDLGAQLVSAKITSKIGVPVLSLQTIITSACFIALLTFLFATALSSFNLPLSLMWIIPVISPLFFAMTGMTRLDKLTALWLFLAALFIGLAFKPKADFKVSSCSCIWLWLIILSAALLRFYGINFGLPFNYHPDEIPKFNVVMSMYNNGTLDPNYFLHPTLLLYSMYFVNVIVHAVLEFFGSTLAFRDTLLLSGRCVSALAGTVSVYFIYVIGKRLFSKETGLMAAAFLTVMPLHITCSRCVKEDALLTFFVLAAAVAVLKAVFEDKKRFLFIAAFLAGCSAGVKYSGALSAFIVFAAPWLKSRSFKPDLTYLGYTLLALLFVPLGFICCTPYSILNYQRFKRDFDYEKSHMQQGHFVTIDAWSYFWLYHFKRSIMPGVSWLLALCSVIGIGISLKRFKIRELYIIALLLLFYLPAEYVKAKPAPQPERYILPCLPFIAILASVALQTVLAQRRTCLKIFFIICLCFPLYRSLSLAADITQDTREKMHNWIKSNIAEGKIIAIDHVQYAYPFPSSAEHPVSVLERETIIEQLDARHLQDTDADYLLLSSLFYDRYFSQQEANPAIRERIRKVFKRYPVIHEETAASGTYGFHNPKLTLFQLK